MSSFMSLVPAGIGKSLLLAVLLSNLLLNFGVVFVLPGMG